MTQFFNTFGKSTISLLISVMLLSACSGSTSTDAKTSTDIDAPVIDGTNVVSNSTATDNDSAASTTIDMGVDESSNNTTNSDQGNNATTPESKPTTPGSEPTAPTLTLIEFDITVPAYVSSALKVELLWGDEEKAIGWIGDEYWGGFTDLPTNTERLLTVTFYDGNGDLTLGSVETLYKTGANDSELVQITADQFDTDRWDNDGDGVSNLDESIAGTNPLLDDTIELKVRESIEFSTIGYYSVEYYESRIPDQRPYFEHTEQVAGPVDIGENYTPILGTTQIITIDIDATGTGSLSDENIDYDLGDRTDITQVATRAGTSTSISWIGTWNRYNQSAGVSISNSFDFETKIIDDKKRRFSGVIVRSSLGYGDSGSTRTTFSLVGELIEGTQRCAPVSGTINSEHTSRYIIGESDRVNVSKDMSSQYWTVNSIATQSTNSVETTEEEEYLVRSIDTTFLCDFADWK